MKHHDQSHLGSNDSHLRETKEGIQTEHGLEAEADAEAVAT